MLHRNRAFKRPNAPVQRPRASDLRIENQTRSRGSLAAGLLGHRLMCLTNNLIAVPRHAPVMPVCPTSCPMNPAIQIRIHDLEGATEPTSPPGERPPPHADRLTCPLAQIVLDPLPAQKNRQRPKQANNARDNRDVAPYGDVFGSHEKECCLILRDCQEPPDADPHVPWCGGWEVTPPGYPIIPPFQSVSQSPASNRAAQSRSHKDERSSSCPQYSHRWN